MRPHFHCLTDRQLLALAAAVFAACSAVFPDPIPAAHPDDATPRRGGTLRLASFADLRALDPAIAADALSSSAVELLYAGLVDYDADGNIVPDLATRYEVADGGLTYRFFLREGVQFHDGSPLTADDVKRSIERSLSPDTPNPNASQYETILGYDAFAHKKAEHLEGVVVEGRYVVAIHLRETDARFLAVLALQALRPVCPDAGWQYTDTWHACGAGPFKLPPGGWERGRSLTLVRNEAYYRPGVPYLDAISWQFGMNRATEVYKFEDGDLDMTKDLGEGDLSLLRHDPRWQSLAMPEADKTTLGEAMNTEVPPFDNVEVRRAVAAAVDRDHYRAYKPNSIVPAYQLLPPAVPGYDPHFVGQRYDYAAALEHMAKAGYPFDPKTGKGGYPHLVPYLAYREGTGEYTAQILAQDLAKIGIRLEIRTVNYPTFLALAYRRKAVAMVAPGWQMDFPDPAGMFDPLFMSKQINDDQSTNISFYKNPRVDELLERAHHELDAGRRKALYDEAGHIICDEAPWAFTATYRFYDVIQPYVRGYKPHREWFFYAANTWLDRKDGERPVAARSSPPFPAFLGSLLP